MVARMTSSPKEAVASLRSLLPDTGQGLLKLVDMHILGPDYYGLLEDVVEKTYSEQNQNILQKCDVLLDITWEKLNTYYWKDVDVNWRYTYTVISVLKVLRQVQNLNHLEQDVSLAEIMKSCDMGLLMGAPILDNILARMSSNIQRFFVPQRQLSSTSESETKKPKLDVIINETKSVPRCSCPSLQTFKEQYVDVKQAVIVTGAVDYWPALSTRPWSLDYIKQVAGSRTVPIELGSKYTEDSWTQALLTVSEFIERYIENPSPDTKGYLAQHQLFDQVPELQKDISVPAYCCLGEKEDVDINAWFGPDGTISPLHYDAKHNLLTQVMGWKYVRLYSDEFTDCVYPHPSRLLHNTSQIDVEHPDHDSYPLFAAAPYRECVLGPGEMLYIPQKHWHFVKSLSVSFSVSFWWE